MTMFTPSQIRRLKTTKISSQYLEHAPSGTGIRVWIRETQMNGRYCAQSLVAIQASANAWEKRFVEPMRHRGETDSTAVSSGQQRARRPK